MHDPKRRGMPAHPLAPASPLQPPLHPTPNVVSCLPQIYLRSGPANLQKTVGELVAYILKALMEGKTLATTEAQKTTKNPKCQKNTALTESYMNCFTKSVRTFTFLATGFRNPTEIVQRKTCSERTCYFGWIFRVDIPPVNIRENQICTDLRATISCHVWPPPFPCGGEQSSWGKGGRKQ